MKSIYFLMGFILLQSCEKKSLNEKEILEIIHSHEDYKDLQLKTDFTYGYDFIDSIKIFKATINKENFKPIYEADFNNDRKLDYVINLRYTKTKEDELIKIFVNEDYFNSVVLLSSNEGYRLLNLGKGQVYDIISAKIISHKNQNLIKLLSFKTHVENRNDILKYDTLMIKDNKLTEFVTLTNKHDIEEIIFTQIRGYAPGIEYHLIVKKDSITLQSNFFKDLKGKYIGINNSTFKTLSKYLSDINFNRLQNRYSIGCSDCSTIETKIIFDNGKTKTINDYGERGTLGLVKFYEKVDYIMTHQKWKKIN